MTFTCEEIPVPSVRFPSGTWLVIRCFDEGSFTGIDLGWREPGMNYRNIGFFRHESEARFAIDWLEAEQPSRGITDILTDAGFVKHQTSGLSTGSDGRHRHLSDRTSAFLQFDIGETNLSIIDTSGTYRRTDIATINFYTEGSLLAGYAYNTHFATGLLCALLKARIEAGDGTVPLAATADANVPA